MALAYIRSLAFLMCEPPNRSVASHCYSRSDWALIKRNHSGITRTDVVELLGRVKPNKQPTPCFDNWKCQNDQKVKLLTLEVPVEPRNLTYGSRDFLSFYYSERKISLFSVMDLTQLSPEKRNLFDQVFKIVFFSIVIIETMLNFLQYWNFATLKG